MTQPTPGSRRSARRTFPAASVLALDLGGTRLRAAGITPDGAVVGRHVLPTPRGKASEVVAASLEVLGTARRAAEAAGLRPTALGISAPGPLDPWRGVLHDPPNLDRSLWSFPLAATLGDAVGLPAALDKDTNVAALAEGRFGAARGTDDFVYLTISTGVGGAVVTGGRLMTGADGVAGELGHLALDPDGPVCGCGGRGHLEAFSSGTGMGGQVRRAVAEGRVAMGTPLARIVAEHGADAIGGRDVALAEAEGDPVAAEVAAAARSAFATAVVSIVNVFNPALVVVGGGIAMAEGDRLLGPARRRVRDEAFRVAGARARVVPAVLGDDVGLVGALPLVELRDRKPGATAAGRMAIANFDRLAHDSVDGSVPDATLTSDPVAAGERSPGSS